MAGATMKLSFPLLLFVLLAGCSTTAKPTITPDGRWGLSIDCTGQGSLGSCYQKAGEVCPNSYEVISKDGDVGNQVAVGTKDGFSSTQVATRSMLVACTH